MDGCILLLPASLSSAQLGADRGWDLEAGLAPWNSCPGWQCQDAPGTGRSSGTAAAGRDTLSSSGTGNSVGTALHWVRFDLGSAQADPTQPNPSVFLGMSGLCVPAKTGENHLELMEFTTNPLPDCAAE